MEVGRKKFSKCSLESLCKPATFVCDFKKIINKNTGVNYTFETCDDVLF